jgi:hypothetical protein
MVQGMRPGIGQQQQMVDSANAAIEALDKVIRCFNKKKVVDDVFIPVCSKGGCKVG